MSDQTENPSISPVKEIPGTPFYYSEEADQVLEEMAKDVAKIRSYGYLNPETIKNLYRFFRIKQIHHSNAIEGNALTYGETRLVVEQGLTISGKSLKDSIEAKNLSHALDFLEEVASAREKPITETDVRTIHSLILSGIDDQNAGKYRSSDVEISG